MADIEHIIMHREQFPVSVTFENGRVNEQYMIIPPVHPYIVEHGFDSAVVQAVMPKAVKDALKDQRECRTRRRPKGNLDFRVDGDALIYPDLPVGHPLVVEPRKLSPWGGDHYLQLDAHGNGFGELATGWTPAMAAEYGVAVEPLFRFQRVNGPYGWCYHNLDMYRFLYKNLIIHLNNAVIREKYA